MNEYTPIDCTELTEGDEMLQAGEWVEVASATPMSSSSNIVVRWASGGSMSFPREHRPACRRRVVKEEPSDPYVGDHPTVESVRYFYGDEAAELIANGWTLDSAIDHVTGDCDRMICTHASHADDRLAARGYYGPKQADR